MSEQAPTPIYNTIGANYAAHRRPDPRLAAMINAALGDARSVVNVGAGTGSYEPSDRDVVAIEPSERMIRQRASSAARCVQACAESLPLESGSCDAAMSVLSTHHWSDLARGLRELARVARRRVLILTWIPDVANFWLTDEYFPQILAHDRTIFPSLPDLVRLVSDTIATPTITPVPVPHDCIDGFLGCYWRRPDMYLRDDVRSAISSFSRINAGEGVARLHADLDARRWHTRHALLLTLDALDVGYRLLVCDIP